MKPLYDLNKSFAENIIQGPFYDGSFFERQIPPQSQWHSLFGFSIMSGIGVAACPLTTTAKGVRMCSRLGYDIITYKTVASRARAPHPHPNIAFVDGHSIRQDMLLDVPVVKIEKKDFYSRLNGLDKPILNGKQDFIKQIRILRQVQGKQARSVSFKKREKVVKSVRGELTESIQRPILLALTNSIGNASFDLQTNLTNISRARAALLPGQLLIVSVFGVATPECSLVDDFAYLAAAVKDAGAQVVEANLSCPNVSCGVLSHDVVLVREVVARMVGVLGATPLTIKLAPYKNIQLMNEILCVAAHAGAQGVTGINSISVRAQCKDTASFFGAGREVSGLSGAPIFGAACDFVRTACEINNKEMLDLTIIGTGGIVTSDDFEKMLQCGANAAMSATGAMWNAELAMNYHKNMGNSYGKFTKQACARKAIV